MQGLEINYQGSSGKVVSKKKGNRNSHLKLTISIIESDIKNLDIFVWMKLFILKK